jgi:ABC-type transport system substrate-binding protein
VLQFNPHSRPLSARTLRRALVYAINRPQILEQVFLHEAPGSLGRATSAPFATTSYAYNHDKTVEPHKFDPALAYSLAKTAVKELAGKLPVLRLVCPDEPEQHLAADRIAQQWKAIGVAATVKTAAAVALSAEDGADWDILYRTETLAEPLVDLWQFLALTRSTETAALEHLPMWLRKQLLDLDRVGDGRTAEDLLRRLHEQFWAEVHLIPLWEIDNFLIYRKTIRGVPEHPVTGYQRIERWRVEPWFSREPPL